MRARRLAFLSAMFFSLATVQTSAQEAVFIIRHAEKAAGDDPALLPEGVLRAGRWADMLQNAGIDHVITSTAQRTRETGGIIAEALGVDTDAFAPADIAGITDLISFDYEDGTVLVVGHTETIPNIMSELGAFDLYSLDPEDFGRLFVVIPSEEGPSILDLQMPD